MVDSCISPQYGDGEKPNAKLRFSPKHFRVASSFLSCELKTLANPKIDSSLPLFISRVKSSV